MANAMELFAVGDNPNNLPTGCGSPDSRVCPIWFGDQIDNSSPIGFPSTNNVDLGGAYCAPITICLGSLPGCTAIVFEGVVDVVGLALCREGSPPCLKDLSDGGHPSFLSLYGSMAHPSPVNLPGVES